MRGIVIVLTHSSTAKCCLPHISDLVYARNLQKEGEAGSLRRATAASAPAWT